MKGRRRSEDGQAVAFFVGILVLILGFVAIAIDVGFLYHSRRIAQNAADASALAGAAELPGCGDGVPRSPVDEAYYYAAKNLELKGYNVDSIGPITDTGTFPVTDDGVTVDYPTVFAHVERTQAFVLARLFGVDTGKAPASAEAACLPATAAGICPFYVQAPDISLGPDSETPFGIQTYKIYRFKFGSQSTQTGGNRGFLGIYPRGAAGIKDAIRGGCKSDDAPDYTIEEGELVTDSQTGTIASVWDAIADQFSYEGQTIEGVTYPTKAYCNINFDVSQFTPDSPYDFAVDPSPGQDIEQLIEDCSSDPRPSDNVRGRLWPIAITEDLKGLDCRGNCEFHLDHLAVMYVVCYRQGGGGPSDCDGENPGQSSLYGMFVDKAPIFPNTSGVGNNPLAPKRPLLVR